MQNYRHTYKNMMICQASFSRLQFGEIYCEEKKKSKAMSKIYYIHSIKCKFSKKKKERSKVNNLSFYLRKPEKEK